MINKIRSKEDNVLLLDCGGFFPDRFFNATGKAIAGTGLKAMNLMGYTAMNVGPGEFSLGVDFLREKSADIDFPLAASNLSYAEGISPFTKRYVMAQAGGLKVAVLGVMPQGILDEMPRSGTFGVVKVIPPGEAIEALLPGIRKKADIVILLSQLGLAETKILVDGLKGIDLAICGGKDRKPAGCSEKINPKSPTGKFKTPVLVASARGTHLGYARLAVDDTGRVVMGRSEMIFLNDAVAMDDSILEITGKDIYRRIAEEKKRIAEEERREIEELHKLTPMEYMEKVLKEQSKGGTGQ